MVQKNLIYKVGIIGCGNIFQRHLEAIKENSEHYSLVAICDVNKKRLNLLAKELKVPGYLNHNEMLKDRKKDMNIVIIATPNSYHYQQAIDALEAGFDVIIEKPIDFKTQRVKKIQDKANSLGRRAYAILQVRYNPTVSLVKYAVNNNFIGKIRSVSLIQRWQRPEQYFESWRADINIGGRTLYEVGIHYMDIMQLLFGKPEVLSTHIFNNKHTNVKFEDTVFSVLKFPSGASGSLEVTIAAEPYNLECSISILGSDGFIKIGGKALDIIESAYFANKLNEQKFSDLQSQSLKPIEPNSYGSYSGSCPNHPTVYREIARGHGIEIADSLNVVRFIEDVYNKES